MATLINSIHLPPMLSNKAFYNSRKHQMHYIILRNFYN